MSMPSARNRILGIRMYKYGIKGFSADNLYKLSQALEVSSEYLLSGCSSNVYENEICELFKMFDKEEKEYLLKMIKEIYMVFK